MTMSGLVTVATRYSCGILCQGRDGFVRISYQLGYADLMDAGGPIAPLNYLSPTLCPFRWDFPTLDFKVLNNSQKTLFLTEVVFDIDESRPDPRPLFAIKRMYNSAMLAICF